MANSIAYTNPVSKFNRSFVKFSTIASLYFFYTPNSVILLFLLQKTIHFSISFSADRRLFFNLKKTEALFLSASGCLVA